MHILIANEPRSYREIFFLALQILRPRITTTLVCPEKLDHEVKRVKPQIVLCSHSTRAVEVHSLVWLVFYPDGRNIVQIRASNLFVTSDDLGLNGLLALIDYAEYLSYIQ